MSLLRKWYRIARRFRSTDATQTQVEEELRFHVEMLEKENLDAGLNHREARSAAERRFGDYDEVLAAGIKLRCGDRRRHRRADLLDDLRQDLAYGVRALRRNPGFNLAAGLIIAVGIGVNTAAFSVANAVLFRPLPLTNANRLVSIGEYYPERRQTAWDPVGMPNLRSWQERSDLFEGLAAARSPVTVNLTGAGEPEQLSGFTVSADFFDVLATPPLAGRLFDAADARPGAEPVVLLGGRFWRRRFAADPATVGTTIHLDNKPYTLIGVASSVSLYDSSGTLDPDPRGLHWMQEQDFWLPMAEAAPAAGNPRRVAWVRGIGRLKEGVTVERAQAQIAALGPVVRPGPGFEDAVWSVRVLPLRRAIGASARQPLLLLVAAAGLVLLIMCANIANLLLARTLTRAKEIAVRGALGASRGRLIRQLLTESVPLVVLGGGLGTLLAWWGVNLLLSANPAHRLPRLIAGGASIDGAVLLFALAAATLTIMLCGWPPAAAGARADLHEAMKDSSLRGAARGPYRGLSAVLVGCEVALAVVLVTAGGLLINSFVRAANIELGFEPASTISAEVRLPAGKYGGRGRTDAEDARLKAVFREILARAQALPGVDSIGLSWSRPLSGDWTRMGVNVEGAPEVWREGRYLGDESQEMDDYVDLAAYAMASFMAEINLVTPGYFGALGVPLIRGEYFTQAGPSDPKVVVISKSAARHFFLDADPIGKRLALTQYRGLESWGDWRTVVGLVEDVRQFALEDRPAPQIYLSAEQVAGGPQRLLARANGSVEPLALVPDLRAIVRAVDPDAVLHSVLSLDQLVSQQLGQRRLYMTMVVIFAGCAILLAAVGVFAVLAYATSRRAHEIGVRRALGARRLDVVTLILRQGLGVVLAGLAIGVAASLALSGVLSSLLYEVTPTDPLTFVAGAAALVTVAFFACLIPARRAARIDPISSLRAE